MVLPEFAGRTTEQKEDFNREKMYNGARSPRAKDDSRHTEKAGERARVSSGQRAVGLTQLEKQKGKRTKKN